MYAPSVMPAEGESFERWLLLERIEFPSQWTTHDMKIHRWYVKPVANVRLPDAGWLKLSTDLSLGSVQFIFDGECLLITGGCLTGEQAKAIGRSEPHRIGSR